MNRATPDPVYCMPGIPVPRLETECAFTFPPRTAQCAPPASEFVPDDEDARRVLAHGLMHCFERGIINDEPPQRRFLGLVVRPFWCSLPLLRVCLVLVPP